MPKSADIVTSSLRAGQRSQACTIGATRGEPTDFEILETALTRPSDLTAADLDAVLAAVGPRDAADWAPVLAAVVYARPDLAGPAMVDRLAAVLEAAAASDSAVAAAADVLEALAGTHLAPPAITAIRRVCNRERLAPGTRARLVPLLRAYANWRPEYLSLHELLDLAASPGLTAQREAVLGIVVEPILARDPRAVTDALVERLLAQFGACPRLPYTLHAIGERLARAPGVARRVGDLTAGAFPLRATAAGILTQRSFDLLVVLNVRIGQGDEIVRLVPLLQALLDDSAGMRATVVTPRPHLYDHPRIRTVPILDDDGVDAALAARYDGVMDIEQPGWREVAWRPELGPRVRDLIAAQEPALVIIGDVGYGHFVYRSVRLNGREVAVERALDRRAVEHNYDGCRRLLAELGLWARAAEEPPAGPPLLTAVPSADAEQTWTRLTAALPRPVALLGPFGGAHRLKGYLPERPERVARELTGLIAEGYSVVLVPNGTPWGSREAATAALANLLPGIRRRVEAAPDPAEADADRRLPLRERPDLPYADRVMRLFKYFAARADLVVAVEGWMTHLAYVLGRPFRLVLGALSPSYDWYPAPRGPRQVIAAGLSPKAATAPPDSLGVDDAPPLPPRDRKPLLLAALGALPRTPPHRGLPILERALASEHYDVRATAVAGLGSFLPVHPSRSLVLGALQDLEPVVRATAAEALLASDGDYSHELGPRFRELLAAHRDIARQNWAAVLRLGTPALPALFTAADGDNAVIRREARLALARLLARLEVGRRGAR